METRVQAHVCYRLMYHIVWIPKYRYNLLIKDLEKYFEDTIKSVSADWYPDIEITELKIMSDHIHMVVIIPPKYSISNVIGDIKRHSSRELQKRFDYLRRGKEGMWSIGYYVSSVGLDEERIRKYVQYQEEQDSGRLKAVFEKEPRV